MRINLPFACVCALIISPLMSLHADSAEATAVQISKLEARLLQLEARLIEQEKGAGPSSSVSEARITELETRLAEAEQETKEVKVLAANSAAGNVNSSVMGNTAAYDILANSAWRNLRWTQESQWEQVKPGASMELVVELLGNPPRSIDSAKPRVDEVYYYETSIRDHTNAMRGKVSFRNGKVIAVQKPNFKVQQTAQ